MNKRKTATRTGVVGVIVLAFYALFNLDMGNNGTNFDPRKNVKTESEEKELRKEYVFKLRNKIILVNNEEKNIEELGDVFLDIKKNKGLVKLIKNGDEKAGFINEVREKLRKSKVLYSEEWEPGKEPK